MNTGNAAEWLEMEIAIPTAIANQTLPALQFGYD
jgi:hypothetical protein